MKEFVFKKIKFDWLIVVERWDNSEDIDIESEVWRNWGDYKWFYIIMVRVWKCFFDNKILGFL